MSSKSKIKLLALDVDGTLFTDMGLVTPESIQAIKAAQAAGVTVIIASGRDFDGVPLGQLSEVDIPYVITTNGAAVYKVEGRQCLAEQCLPIDKITPIVETLMTKEVHISAFIDGHKRTPPHVEQYIKNLGVPDHIKQHLSESPYTMDNFLDYVRSGNAKIQKITLNFQQLEDGSYLNRAEIADMLYSCPYISVVNGGFFNLEMTAKGVNKGLGLQMLAEQLGISMEETMAIGDSENDLDMLKVAGLGIAMDNASDTIKEAADAITLSNEENGVAYAIEKYIL